jgi:hypothetical protein
MTRSNADWAALCRSEIDGHEAPGTVGRLLAEVTGKPVASDAEDIGTAARALSNLAEVVKNPKLLTDIHRETEAHKAAREAALAEQKKLSKAKQDLAAERARHEAALDREIKEHKAVLAAANAELDRVRAQAATLKAQSEANAAKAKADAAEQARRLRALEGAAA